MDSLLSIVTFTPLTAAAILGLFLRGDDEAAQRNSRILALTATTATFLMSLFVLHGFDPSNTGFQFLEDREWLPGLHYRMGIDGISLPFLLLTTFLMPVTILACWNVGSRVKEFMIAFLVLETLMIGVFCALDLVLFYFFFESGLLPLFLIIGIWGGQRRVYATFKFFLYTLLGSILMLIAMIGLWRISGTTSVPELLVFDVPSESLELGALHIAGGLQTIMWLAFFASFAVKLPMWPFHTWLPDAHVEAPTGGSVVLAAILLKMGGYGFLRFSLPMFPVASDLLAPLVMWLSVAAIIYASLVALAQEDMKKLIAYSSVAHMGFVTIGIFVATRQGIDGAIFQMLSHGFISAALFLCVGAVYDRTHDRRIASYGGLALVMPAYALLFMFFTLANVGLPGTSGFVGEFLTLLAAFGYSGLIATLATTGIILSAAYALWLARRVLFGDWTGAVARSLKDLDLREKLVFLPLVIMILILGLYPSLVTDITGPTAQQLADRIADLPARDLSR